MPCCSRDGFFYEAIYVAVILVIVSPKTAPLKLQGAAGADFHELTGGMRVPNWPPPVHVTHKHVSCRGLISPLAPWFDLLGSRNDVFLP
jgi:hypothetical protein